MTVKVSEMAFNVRKETRKRTELHFLRIKTLQ